MRAGILLICAACGLIGGLGWVYLGVTSTTPYPWIYVVSGVLTLVHAVGLFSVRSKTR